ncbi:MAG: hypothetical protein ABIL25_08025 [candidate division WOR-3 bacterium]
MSFFNEVERLKLVHRFQYEHDVSRLQVDGLRVWPVVLLQLVKLTATNFGARSLLDIVKLAAKGVLSYGTMVYGEFRDRTNSIHAPGPADVLFLTDPKRRVRVVNVFFDRISDPFFDALSKSGYCCSTLEWSIDHEYRVPRYNPSDLIQGEIDRVTLKSLLRRRRPRQELTALGTKGFREILDYHGVGLDTFVNDLTRSARLILALKDYFLRKLGKKGALMSFYSPYYGNVAFGFNLACKALGIYTVEIQHGYYGEMSLLYNGYRNVNCRYDLLPDAFWVWEDRDRDAVWAWGDDKSLLPYVYVGGNLWNNFWKYPEANDNRYAAVYDHLMLRQGSGRVVLLTLPPAFDIPDWLPNAIRDTAGEVTWYVRYHHHMKGSTAARYRNAFRDVSNVEYELSNRLPLPILFRLCDLHITVNSSSVAEAKEFSRKSIIVSEIGVRIFSSFISDGWAYPALSKEQLLGAIHRILNERPRADKSAEAAGIRSNSEIIRDFIARLDRNVNRGKPGNQPA